MGAFAVFSTLVEFDAVTLMSALQLPRVRQACWLFAVALSAAAWLAEAEPAAPIFPRPPVPQPMGVHLRDLPAGFTKPSPTSMEELRDIQNHVAALVSQVSSAVVAVVIDDSSGSGVVITSDGLVLTAGHVGERAGRQVKFTFPNGSMARGKTLGVDEDADTGLMRITDPGPWPHVGVGELKHAQLGDWTLALGNPGGFDLKRSLVARLGRIIQLTPDHLQTDCTIFPGDSGGPLFDMYGRVIGIHSSITTSAEENYHVPITRFFATWEELIGPPERLPSYCGLSVVDDPEGCRVSKIEKDSPATLAKLKLGDVLLSVDGRHVAAASWFEHWLIDSAPGETLKLQIKRDKKELSKAIKLQSQPRSSK